MSTNLSNQQSQLVQIYPISKANEYKFIESANPMGTNLTNHQKHQSELDDDTFRTPSSYQVRYTLFENRQKWYTISSYL